MVWFTDVFTAEGIDEGELAVEGGKAAGVFVDTSTDRGGGGGEHDSEGDALGHEACEGGGGFSDCNCEVLAWISLTVLLSSCILSYSIFSLSIMQSNLAFISFRCFSMEAQQPCV